MDPEDLREVISAYQKCVAETVRRFGGFVAKYLGDGVLVYFGYPQAHEDDAERAVRAGLELIAAVSALKAASPLQTRIGIATGLVVVGDLIGTGCSPGASGGGRAPTSQPDCRSSLSRTRWSSQTVRDGFSAICSNLRTWEPKTSKVFLRRCGRGRHCGPARLRAALKRCMQVA